MDISSGSAAYLRQKIAKAKKQESASIAEGKTEEPVVEDNGSVEGSTVESDKVTESATLDVDSEESFAASIKVIATQQGLDLAKVIATLLKG
jgi:hypothetical protein